MDFIVRKVKSLYKLFIKNRLTKPIIMGEKILILACAPCVNNYFKHESVRMQFRDYDIAFINFMIVHSENDMFQIKPKYIMLIDPIFYDDDPLWEKEREQVWGVLNRINWECTLVTSVLADFKINNNNITIHRISCFEIPYREWLLPFFRKNMITPGLFNIMQAAIYYSITFGYKKIAILGCNYQMSHMKMVESGLRITYYEHYYDQEKEYAYLSWDELNKMKNGYISSIFERASKSAACFFSLAKYAQKNNAEVINYSDDSALDGFKVGHLEINNIEK